MIMDDEIKISCKRIKRRFWFDKVEYHIVWEYCTLGPFRSYNEALKTVNHYKEVMSDIGSG